MQSVGKTAFRQARFCAALAVAALPLAASPAAAFDLFGRHEVTVQFATADGKAMADAEVRVFAPDNPARVVQTGRTDQDGKFAFPADRDGMWSAEAHNDTEIARATIRVGAAPGAGAGGGELSPYVMIGALALLLALAVGFHFLRARARRR